MHALALAALLAALGGAPPALSSFEPYAREVERGLAAGKPEALTLDVDALLARATDGVDAPEDFRTGFGVGVRQTGGKLGTTITQRVKAGGSLRLLRVRPEGVHAVALYRLLDGNGVTYFELTLERAPGDGIHVVDAFFLQAGQPVSSLLRGGFLIAAAEAKTGFLDRLLLGKERLFLDHAATLKDMNEALTAKRYREVLELYEGLPGPLRAERLFLVTRFTAASLVHDDGEYTRAIADWQAAFPDDPSADLIAIDGHVLAGRYGEALAAVDRLDARLRDPYLSALRGGIILRSGDRTAARAAFRKAIEREPTLAPPYWQLVQLALGERDFAEVARLLTALEQRAGARVPDLTTLPDYAAFVQSPAYQAFRAHRPVGDWE